MIGSENENELALDNVAGIRERTQPAGLRAEERPNSKYEIRKRARPGEAKAVVKKWAARGGRRMGIGNTSTSRSTSRSRRTNGKKSLMRGELGNTAGAGKERRRRDGVERLAAHPGGARCLAFSRYLPRFFHCDRADRCDGRDRKRIFRFPGRRNAQIHETRRILLMCLDRCHRSRREAPITSQETVND
jgi:hypothetical protein